MQLKSRERICLKKKLNDSAWTVKVKIRTRKKFLAVDEMCGREREREKKRDRD